MGLEMKSLSKVPRTKKTLSLEPYLLGRMGIRTCKGHRYGLYSSLLVMRVLTVLGSSRPSHNAKLSKLTSEKTWQGWARAKKPSTRNSVEIPGYPSCDMSIVSDYIVELCVETRLLAVNHIHNWCQSPTPSPFINGRSQLNQTLGLTQHPTKSCQNALCILHHSSHRTCTITTNESAADWWLIPFFKTTSGLKPDSRMSIKTSQRSLWNFGNKTRLMWILRTKIASFQTSKGDSKIEIGLMASVCPKWHFRSIKLICFDW